MSHLDTYHLSRLLRNCITLAEIAKGYNNHARRNEDIQTILTFIDVDTRQYNYPVLSQDSQDADDLLELLRLLLKSTTEIKVHTVVRQRLNFFISVCQDHLEMLKHRENNPGMSDSDIRYYRWSDPSRLFPKDNNQTAQEQPFFRFKTGDRISCDGKNAEVLAQIHPDKYLIQF